MFLVHKGRPIKGDFLLIFHYDPAEITDSREVDWKEDTSAGAIPTLQFDHVGVREVSFTTIFSDFATGRPPKDGIRSTQESIQWLRKRMRSIPGLWVEPPTLLFSGLRPDLVIEGTLFSGVIKSVEITSKVHAGRAVLSRPSLLLFPTKVKEEGDIVRAEVKITLKEKLDATQDTPQSLIEAFQFGVREGARRAEE